MNQGKRKWYRFVLGKRDWLNWSTSRDRALLINGIQLIIEYITMTYTQQKYSLLSLIKKQGKMNRIKWPNPIYKTKI